MGIMKSSSSAALVFVVLMVVAATIAPKAEAQLLGAGGSASSFIRINGTVTCSANATVNGTNTAPPFANATVQLQCGGVTLATTTTNANGSFSLPVNTVNLITALLSPLQILNPAALLSYLTNPISFLIPNCKVVVPTPLSVCNATLPSTGLRSLLQPLETIVVNVGGFVTIIINLVLQGFQLIPS